MITWSVENRVDAHLVSSIYYCTPWMDGWTAQQRPCLFCFAHTAGKGEGRIDVLRLAVDPQSNGIIGEADRIAVERSVSVVSCVHIQQQHRPHSAAGGPVCSLLRRRHGDAAQRTDTVATPASSVPQQSNGQHAAAMNVYARPPPARRRRLAVAALARRPLYGLRS